MKSVGGGCCTNRIHTRYVGSGYPVVARRISKWLAEVTKPPCCLQSKWLPWICAWLGKTEYLLEARPRQCYAAKQGVPSCYESQYTAESHNIQTPPISLQTEYTAPVILHRLHQISYTQRTLHQLSHTAHTAPVLTHTAHYWLLAKRQTNNKVY